MKKANARCELDGKRLSTVGFRCTPDTDLALRLEADRRGITVSDLMNTLAKRHILAQRLSDSHSRHPARETLCKVIEKVEDALGDDFIDHQEGYDINDAGLDFLSKVKEWRGVA